MVGKGKEVMVQSSRPLKNQRLEPIPEQRRLISTPELGDRMEKLNTQQCLVLHKNAGASGQAMAVDLGARVAQSCNLISGDLWEHFKRDEPTALLELSLMSSVVVSIY